MDLGTKLMIGVVSLVVIAGAFFTLWWWKLADKWADAEHKRFKVKIDPRPKVVVRSEPEQGERAGEPNRP